MFSCVVVQSAMKKDVSHLVAVTDKALNTVLVGRATNPYYYLLGQTLMALVLTDSSH